MSTESSVAAAAAAASLAEAPSSPERPPPTSTPADTSALVVNCNGGTDQSTVASNAPTTTISTIAVQAGPARIVIALLKSKEELQLEILEMEPDLCRVGSTLDEALDYQRQHEEVLAKLQGKQSPVEELLNQADQLISTQKPKAEVYAAMAESLGLAWRDLNNQLEHRKQLLEQSVVFHQRAKEFSDRLDKGERECKDPAALPSDAEMLRKVLQQHHELKKGILEASMYSLNESQLLLERLREVAVRGTGDARPDYLRQSANSAIFQVEQLLESLHDRRRRFEELWSKHKQNIEECLQLCLLYGDIAKIQEWLTKKSGELSRETNLGDSSASAEIMHHECGKLQTETKQVQDRAIRLLRTAEQLTSAGHPASTQAESKTYALLDNCTEFADRVDNRLHLLDMAVSFFRSAQSALTKLDQIDVQLATSDPSCGYAQLAHAVEEIVNPALQEGHALLEKADEGKKTTATQGIQRTINELEERRRKLDTFLAARKQETAQKSDALRTFQTTFNNLYMWIVNNGENFLQGHRDMGSVLAMAKEFLQRHETLLKDVLNKGPEVDAVFRSIPNLLRSAPDDVSEIDETMERLRTSWIEVNTHLESRIQVSRLYYNFHRLAVQLANELDSFENNLFALRDGSQPAAESTTSDLEEKWLTIQQSSLQMKNTGKNFIADAKKSKDPYLDVQRAILCVETLLEHFESRMSHLDHMKDNYKVQTTQNKEIQMLWETNATNIRKSMQWITTIEVDLYPVVSGNVMNVQSIIWDLERKLDTFVPNIKKAHAELEVQMKAMESLSLKGAPQVEKETLTSELTSVSQRLHTRIMDYEILLNILVAYFKKILELEKMVDKLEGQYVSTMLSTADVNSVEVLSKEHEASKHAVLELFRFSANERKPIVTKIYEMEPDVAARHDEAKLVQVLDLIQQHWEKSWREHRRHLEQQLQLCQFNQDLKQINNQLDELFVHLMAVKGNYGESLPAAKATSQAFVQFEKTIQLLEQRVQIFTSTAQKMLSSNHSESHHIKFEIENLQHKWSTFHTQVSDNRKLLDIAIEYFKLVDETEEFFKEGNKLLIQIARKSTSCRNPEEARSLLNDVQRFRSSGQFQQQERLSKISSLTILLYGNQSPLKVNDVSTKNKEMLDSFSVINDELNTLASNLKSSEVQRELYQKEKEEMDAALVIAKAEAADAKAAAAASDEARRAAETAARAPPLHVFERIHVKEIHEQREAVPLPKNGDDDDDNDDVDARPPSSPPILVDKLPRHVAPVFIVPLEDAEIVEGVKFKFHCRVTGFPVPDVQWFKDGIAIGNNPDYKTSHDDDSISGLCTLTIEETFSEDSATFTCKAGNAAGIVETRGRLTVKENLPAEELVPPEFVKPLEPAVSRVGETFQFECQVSGKPTPIISWMKNDVSIDTSLNYVISTSAEGICVLKFHQLDLDDVAKYTCRATNKAGVASSTANLIVQLAEQLESPIFVQPLSNVMARAGQKLRLECGVRGVPHPELTWLHNHKPLKDMNREFKIQFDGRSATLVISEAFPKDAGVYVVVAKNRAGEATSSCTVTVKGRLPLETSDSELASDLEPVKPRILLELNDIASPENNSIRMDCIIVGQPEPEVIWYHNGKPVKESNDYQLLFEGDKCSLIIRQALTDDTGEYKVVAINSAGEAASRCHLTVTPSSAAEKTESVIFSVEKATPPKFITLPVDSTVTEGEPFEVRCTVTGDPSPVITWLKDNRQLQPSFHHQTSRDANSGLVTLNVAQVTRGDSGTYTVKASNVAGDAKCLCNVTVVSPSVNLKDNETRLVEKCALEDSAKPPVFVKLFADQVANVGETTKFECVITASPTAKVQWFFQGKRVTPDDFPDLVVAAPSDNSHTLTMSAVTPNSNGRVTCTAENDSGKATCTAVLQVAEPCQIIIPYDEDDEKDAGTMEQRYKMTSVTKSSTSMTTQKSFRNTTTAVSSGGNVEFHQLATKEEHALQKINDVPVQELHSSKKEEIHRRDPSLAPLQISQSTKAMLETQSLSIENTAPQFPNVVQSSINKPEAPRFVQPVKSVLVNAGDPVTFQGQVEGYPEPSVKWYKNSVEIFRSDFQTSFADDGTVTLKIPKTVAKDAGRYTCTARNTGGTASSAADLIVKSVQSAPQFIKSLQAQVVPKGQRVEMEVQVSGIPEPQVTFYKNGHPIAGTGRCRLKSNGNKAVLVIPEATSEDSGKYMVKAINSAGEAHSVSDFVVEHDDVHLMPQQSKGTVTSKHITTVYEQKQQQQTRSSSAVPSTPEVTATEPSKPHELISTGAERAQEVPKFSPTSFKPWTPQTQPEKPSVESPPSTLDARFPKPKVAPQPPPKPKSITLSPRSGIDESEDDESLRRAPSSSFRSPPPLTSTPTPPPSKIPIQSHFRPVSQSPLPSSPALTSEDDAGRSPATSWQRQQLQQSTVEQHVTSFSRPTTTTAWKPVCPPPSSSSTTTTYKKSTAYEEVSQTIMKTSSSTSTSSTKRIVTSPTQPIDNQQPALEPGPPPEFGYIDPKTVHRRPTTSAFAPVHARQADPVVRQPSKSPSSATPTSFVKPIYASEFPRGPSPDLKPGTPPEIGFMPAPSSHRSPASPADHGQNSSPAKSPTTKLVSGVWKSSPSLSAPVFVKPLQDKHVEAGEQVTFDCIVLGDPTPCIQWLRDGRSIPEAQQSTHQYNMCLLTIPAARSNDEGTITCLATNPAGTATSSAALKISDGGDRSGSDAVKAKSPTTLLPDSTQQTHEFRSHPQHARWPVCQNNSYVMSRINQFSRFK